MLKFHVDYISHSGKKLHRVFQGFLGGGGGGGGPAPGHRGQFFNFFLPLWLFGFQKNEKMRI